MRLGKLTDYGTVLLVELARAPAEQRSALELAERTQIGAPTVAKLLRQLAQAGILRATRGSQGGYRLARPPARITVAEVVAALEGPIALTTCAADDHSCPIDSHCGVRGNWSLINRAIEAALASVSLADMTLPAGSREFPLRRVEGTALSPTLPPLRGTQGA